VVRRALERTHLRRDACCQSEHPFVDVERLDPDHDDGAEPDHDAQYDTDADTDADADTDTADDTGHAARCTHDHNDAAGSHYDDNHRTAADHHHHHDPAFGRVRLLTLQ
jgi:hypothetical protein